MRLISGTPQTQLSATVRTLSNNRTASSLPPLASAVNAHAKTSLRICTSSSARTPPAPAYRAWTWRNSTSRSNTGYIMPISSSYTRHSRAASTPSTVHNGSPSRLGFKHGDDIGDGSCVSPRSSSLSGPSSIPRCWRLDLARSKPNADVVGPVKSTSLPVDGRIHLEVACCISAAVAACVGADADADTGDNDCARVCTVLDSMAIWPCMDEI